jgi:hypothetical protein
MPKVIADIRICGEKNGRQSDRVAYFIESYQLIDWLIALIWFNFAKTSNRLIDWLFDILIDWLIDWLID